MIFKAPLLRVVTKIIVPPIILFALYVQFHGDFGPGGGFQAGVIMAAAFILYGLVFGVETARQAITADVTRIVLALGVLLFGGTGIVTMMMGAEFLDYSVLGKTPLAGQHLGILLIEFGVGMTVAGAMVTIFFTFAGHGKDGNIALDQENEGEGND
ncbi:MAG: cation:proton antiporter [Rhodospirillaceae bacterium]|nr:MAG: cation:proton antiporter [Rhodospirillaceae bacterium]